MQFAQRSATTVLRWIQALVDAHVLAVSMVLTAQVNNFYIQLAHK